MIDLHVGGSPGNPCQCVAVRMLLFPVLDGGFRCKDNDPFSPISVDVYVPIQPSLQVKATPKASPKAAEAKAKAKAAAKPKAKAKAMPKAKAKAKAEASLVRVSADMF
eukprot:s82_g7.t1